MIRVIGNIYGPDEISTLEYLSVDHFMQDYFCEDFVEQELNNIYDDIEIPYIGKIPAGKAIRTLNDDYWKWISICDEFASSWTKTIKHELATSGRCDFRGFKIIDTTFKGE